MSYIAKCTMLEDQPVGAGDLHLVDAEERRRLEAGEAGPRGYQVTEHRADRHVRDANVAGARGRGLLEAPPLNVVDQPTRRRLGNVQRG